MNLSKLKQIHVVIIGAFLCIAAGAALYFLMIKPKQEEYANTSAAYEAANAIAITEPQAIKKVIDAKNKLEMTQQNLNMEMSRRMPNLRFEQRMQGMMALWREYNRDMRPILNGYARSARRVTADAAFNFPTPPYSPNDAIFENDMISVPLGNVVAVGDFRSLMDSIRNWNNCSRLIMVDQPTLAGSSPNLAMTYKVTCYIFPYSKATPDSKVKMAGEAGAAAPGAGALGTGAPGGGAPGGGATGPPPQLHTGPGPGPNPRG